MMALRAAQRLATVAGRSSLAQSSMTTTTPMTTASSMTTASNTSLLRLGVGMASRWMSAKADPTNPLDNTQYGVTDPSTPTHTGVSWEANDPRNVRFTDRKKEINQQFAQSLIQEQAVTMVHGRTVACDGGGGALGHPKVFINLDAEGPQACPYCGRLFEQFHP